MKHKHEPTAFEICKVVSEKFARPYRSENLFAQLYQIEKEVNVDYE